MARRALSRQIQVAILAVAVGLVSGFPGARTVFGQDSKPLSTPAVPDVTQGQGFSGQHILDGIFAGLGRGLVAGATGVGFGVSSVYVTFYPDGRVYRRVPEGGLEGWDRDAAESAVPDLWGRYRALEPGRWAIEWNHSDEPAIVTREGDGLRYEDGVVLPVATCEGLLLHAIYASPGYQDAADPYFIAFNDEGLFVDWGLVGSIAYQDLNAYDSRTIAGGAGHYRIGRNTLYLDYEDGRRVRVEIHARTDDVEQRPIPVIYINGWELVRVETGQ